MSTQKQSTQKPVIFQYRRAKVGNLFDNVQVIVGSEEKIFEDIYMTGLVQNNRPVKFKKSALEFA